MFCISVDRPRHRLDVAFVGTYADFDADAFAAELRAGARLAKGGSDYFDLIADFSRAPVMPKEVAADSETEIAWCVANGLRRSANVVDSALSKMQVKRVAPDARFRMFATRAEALAWLDSAA